MGARLGDAVGARVGVEDTAAEGALVGDLVTATVGDDDGEAVLEDESSSLSSPDCSDGE